MREAYFGTIFCGIETPDPVALKAMHKDHNMMVPIMEAIKTLNNYGMEVVSGIILGLDTDKPETGQHLLEFIDASQIPLLTINLLQALPQTPLWDRLKRENRLIEDEGRDSNVDFRLPYEDVVRMWRACMNDAYQPGRLLERYEYQIRETYPHRITPPPSRATPAPSAVERPVQGRHPDDHAVARLAEVGGSGVAVHGRVDLAHAREWMHQDGMIG